MRRNIELLSEVMQHIDDHPEQHNSVSWINSVGTKDRFGRWVWSCGTVACYAGWTALLARDVRWLGGNAFEYQGEWYDAEDVATIVLGLAKHEADCLFYCLDTRAQLRLAVKDLVNGDELRSPDEYVAEADESRFS